MSSEKRYFWLKLHNDFFNSKRIKKLRRIAGGDTFTIIYLKLQLASLQNDGVIEYTGLEKDVVTEIALDIDERPDDVAVTLDYLLKCGLAETSDNVSFFFPFVVENTGSEGSSAARMRRLRDREKTSLCDDYNLNRITKTSRCDEDILKKVPNPSRCDKKSSLCYGEIEKELELEKDIENIGKKPSTNKFVPPTPEEVEAYVNEKGYNVDANRFVDFYQSKGWMVGKSKMKDWKAAVRNWSRDSKPKAKEVKSDDRGYTMADLIGY